MVENFLIVSSIRYETFSYTVQADSKDKPLIKVNFKDEAKTFTPERLVLWFLLKMKETAESFLGQKALML